MFCAEQNELARRSIEVLGRIARISQQQIEALKKGDQARLARLDKELEMLFGEKERAFGALNQHRCDHGC